MGINNDLKLYFLIILFAHTAVKSENFVTEKEVGLPTSFFVQQVKDSVSNIKEFNEIKLLYDSQKYEMALKGALYLLEKSKNNNSIKIQLLTTSLIGNIFMKTNNLDKAIEYYKKYLRVKKYIIDNTKISKDSDDEGYANVLLTLAGSYQLKDQRDSAKFFYNKILKLNPLNDKILTIQARTYTNLSAIYYLESSYDNAKAYAKKSIEINKKQGNKIYLSEILSNMANIYLEEGKLERAKDLYFEAIRLIEENKDLKSVRNKEKVYDNLALALYNQKNYLAYKYLDRSFDIRDSLREVEIRDVIRKIETEHVANIERSKVELKRLQERRASLLFGLLALSILVISSIILYNYRLRQNNLKLKLSKSKLIQQKKIDELKSEAQVRILNATIDGKESERKQIAETLHDSVSTLLSSANMHLQASRKQFNDNSPIEIEKTQKILNEAHQKIRDLSHTLVSSILLKFGLATAVVKMAEKYSNSKIQIDTDTRNIKRYQQEFEIKIYNIIQELVNNILKHSNAENAFVFLKEENDILTVKIQDDGEGFNKKEISKKDGMGIHQIDARVKMMHGTFSINTSKGKGTKISIQLPIVKKEIITHV